MKTTINLFSLLIIALSAVLYSGCAKEVAKIAEKESVADRNSIFAEMTFNQEEAQVTAAMITQGFKSTDSGSASGSECLITTYDLLASPMKLTLDYGTTNCPCTDGKNRRGKVLVTFNGNIMDSLTVVSLTFDNYFVNDNQVTGTRTTTTKGHNAAGHLNQDVSTNGSIIMSNNVGTISYLSNQNREWTEGENTLVTTDDVYSFTGSSSGTTTTGKDFTTTVTTPLVWKMSCTNFVSGVIELKPAGDPKRVIDFGAGECDNKATVTVLGFSFQITMG